MSGDPFGYVQYKNVTGSGSSGSAGGGCSPGCLGAVLFAVMIFLSVVSACSS